MIYLNDTIYDVMMTSLLRRSYSPENVSVIHMVGNNYVFLDFSVRGVSSTKRWSEVEVSYTSQEVLLQDVHIDAAFYCGLHTA